MAKATIKNAITTEREMVTELVSQPESIQLTLSIKEAVLLKVLLGATSLTGNCPEYQNMFNDLQFLGHTFDLYEGEPFNCSNISIYGVQRVVDKYIKKSQVSK